MFRGGPPRKSSLLLAEEMPRPTFGVVIPNAPEEQPEVPPTPEISLPDALLMRLAELNPQSEELLDRRSKLLSMLRPLLKEFAALETAVHDERRTTLKSSLDSIRERGRAQQKLVAELEVEFRDRDVEFQNFAGAHQEALETVRALKAEHAEQQGRFDSDATLAKRDAAMQAAMRKMGEAKRAGDDALVFRNDAQSKLIEARRILNNIAAEEVAIRNSLNGTSFVDAETGLTVG